MSASLTSSAASAPRPSPKPMAPAPRLMLRYVAGNAGALLWGLIVSYFALLKSGHITSVTIRTGDFVQYFSVSRLILDGHGGAIYDFHRLSQVEASIVYPLTIQNGVLPFLNPPYFALLTTPLAVLPYGAAYLLVLVINCVALMLAMFAFEQYAGLAARSALVVRLAVICSLPVIMTLLLGQLSILILGLVSLSFFAARSGRYGVAGAALAFGLIKPPYVVPFLVVFLVQRHWRAIAAFGLTCLGLVLAPIPILGISIDRVYAQLLADVTGFQGQSGVVTYHHVLVDSATYDPHVNVSLAGFFRLLLAAPAAKAATLAATVIALLLLAWCARHSAGLDLPFGLAAVTALLINPHVLAHDLTLLVIPVWIALRYRQVGLPYLPALLAAVYVTTATGSSLSYAFPLQVSVLAMLALGVWLFLTSLRTGVPLETVRLSALRNPAGAGPAP